MASLFYGNETIIDEEDDKDVQIGIVQATDAVSS
jgi:hypothetical protein